MLFFLLLTLYIYSDYKRPQGQCKKPFCHIPVHKNCNVCDKAKQRNNQPNNQKNIWQHSRISSDAGVSHWLSDLVLKVKAVTHLSNDLVLEEFGAKLYSATTEIESNNSEPNLYLSHCRRNIRLINGHPKRKRKKNNSKSYAAFIFFF